MAKAGGSTGSSSNLEGVRFKYTLTGVSPLLMHFDNIEAEDEAAARGKEPGSKAGDDRHPAGKWKQYLYSDGLHVGIPFANIMAAMCGGMASGRNQPSMPLPALVRVALPETDPDN